MTGKHALRLLGAVFAALLLWAGSGRAEAVGSARVLRVAFYPLDGFFEYGPGGEECGYGVDLLERLGEYTGIRFEYVPAETWADTQDMLLSGEADIRMPGTMPSKPSATLGYTGESVMDTYRAVMTLKSRTDLYYKDYERFPYMRIAMTRSLYDNTDVGEYLRGLGLEEKYLIFYDEYSLCRQALDAGSVDAVISNIMDLTDDMKVLARFDAVSNYITMPIGSPWLDELDAALKELKMDDPSFLPLLYQKYYPERTAAPYTREEARFVQSAGVITVGQLAGTDPLSYLDAETGRVSGIFVELCELIAKKSGLTFRYDLVPQGTRAVDWLAETDGRIVAGVMFSALSSPSPLLSRTDTAFTASVVIVVREGESFDPQGDMVIAVPVGFIGGETYIRSEYPNADVRFYGSNELCLEAIVSGEADALLQNLYVVRSALQSPRFDSLEILPVYEVDEEMKLVMAGDENPLLISVINKALASISDEELSDIIVANTIAKPYSITLKDTVYKYRVPLCVIGLLVLLALILLWNILLIRHRNMLRMEEKNSQLAEAYEQARVASKAKGDFLARMSHEIRTPMNAITGMTTLAMDHTDSPELIRQDLERVALSSHVLLTIINDVLDMSAIESGKLKIDHAPFDFRQLLSSLTAVYSAQCRAKGLAFQTKLISPVDERLVGDQLRVNQVLMNLLSNAVKFTDRGSVSLTVEQRAAAGDGLCLRMDVSDTGCGMAPDMLARLWTPFEQESAVTAREHDGSGLGLSIVKGLVTMMGGDITARSEPGAGSTFSVELPFGRAGDEERAPAADGGGVSRCDLRGRRVLLAEDNDMNRLVGAGLLKKAGVICETAANGALALDMFTASEPGYYDAILMDVQMPVMDGYEATRAIRASGRPGAGDIPILAMTANAFTEDVVRCLQCGMDGHVAKPIELELLLGALDRAISAKEAHTT